MTPGQPAPSWAGAKRHATGRAQIGVDKPPGLTNPQDMRNLDTMAAVTPPISRRRFLGRAAAASLLPTLAGPFNILGAEPATPAGPGFRWTDFHVHLDNSTIDKALELSRQRGVKFGIVEHAGTKENKYPRVLEQRRRTERLSGNARGQAGLQGRSGRVDRLDDLFLPRGPGATGLRPHRRHDLPGQRRPPRQALGSRCRPAS